MAGAAGQIAQPWPPMIAANGQAVLAALAYGDDVGLVLGLVIAIGIDKYHPAPAPVAVMDAAPIALRAHHHHALAADGLYPRQCKVGTQLMDTGAHLLRRQQLLDVGHGRAHDDAKQDQHYHHFNQGHAGLRIFACHDCSPSGLHAASPCARQATIGKRQNRF